VSKSGDVWEELHGDWVLIDTIPVPPVANEQPSLGEFKARFRAQESVPNDN